MKSFAKIGYGFKLLTILAKRFVLDGSEYTTELNMNSSKNKFWIWTQYNNIYKFKFMQGHQKTFLVNVDV